MSKIIRKHLLNSLTDEKLDHSIEKLIELLDNYMSQKEDKSVSDMYATLYVHLRTFKELSVKKSQEIIDPKDYQLKTNNIVVSLVVLINKIPASVLELAEAERQKEEQAEAKRQKRQAERARKAAEAERQKEEQAEQARKAALDPFAGQMVYISGGTFQMGSNDGFDNEKPPHSVTVSGFYMSKYQVTQAQWRAVMGSDPSELYNKGCDQCPVEGVSFEDVKEFIAKLNAQTGKDYRLPTEAEWEYAARGGQPDTYAGSHDIDRVAWYYGNYQSSRHGSQGTTHPVGQLKANDYGLYDMSGNVWEWCNDWYKGYPGSSGVPDYTGSHRVLRGGGWNYLAQYCRVADRNYVTPAFRDGYIGFRLVVSR
jgi:formylglycine-generating enzyme required for sulfatase activity